MRKTPAVNACHTGIIGVDVQPFVHIAQKERRRDQVVFKHNDAVVLYQRFRYPPDNALCKAQISFPFYQPAGAESCGLPSDCARGGGQALLFQISRTVAIDGHVTFGSQFIGGKGSQSAAQMGRAVEGKDGDGGYFIHFDYYQRLFQVYPKDAYSNEKEAVL